MAELFTYACTVHRTKMTVVNPLLPRPNWQLCSTTHIFLLTVKKYAVSSLFATREYTWENK
jgi:hypothetical protein